MGSRDGTSQWCRENHLDRIVGWADDRRRARRHRPYGEVGAQRGKYRRGSHQHSRSLNLKHCPYGHNRRSHRPLSPRVVVRRERLPIQTEPQLGTARTYTLTFPWERYVTEALPHLANRAVTWSETADR